MKEGRKNNNWKGATILSDDGVTAVVGLRGGGEAVIDSEDVVKIIDYSWQMMRNHAGQKRKSNIYAYTRSEGKSLLMHRVVLGAPKGKQTDHINRNTLDNRKKNLRLVDQFENMHNSTLPFNRYGMTGVRQGRDVKNRFYSSIKINGKTKYLGTFGTKEECHCAYMREKVKLTP